MFTEELVSHGVTQTRLPSELRLYDWVDPGLVPFSQRVVAEALAAGQVFQAKGIR